MTAEELREIERECRQIRNMAVSPGNQGGVAFYTARRLAEFIGALALHLRKDMGNGKPRVAVAVTDAECPRFNR